VLLSTGRKIESPDTAFEIMTYRNRKSIRDYGVAFDDLFEAVKRGFLK